MIHSQVVINYLRGGLIVLKHEIYIIRSLNINVNQILIGSYGILNTSATAL